MVISEDIIRVTPFRAPIALLITYLLSPLPLQVGFRDSCRYQVPRSFTSGLGSAAWMGPYSILQNGWLSKLGDPRVPLKGSFNGIYKGSMKGLGFRVVVKIMVPFWVPNIVRHLLFKVPKTEP